MSRLVCVSRNFIFIKLETPVARPVAAFFSLISVYWLYLTRSSPLDRRDNDSGFNPLAFGFLIFKLRIIYKWKYDRLRLFFFRSDNRLDVNDVAKKEFFNIWSNKNWENAGR